MLTAWGTLGVGATLLVACGPQPSPAAKQPTSSAASTQADSAPVATAGAQTGSTQAPPQAGVGPARNGGTFRFSIWSDDPPALDPYLNVSFRVQETAGFFYSRLLRSKKGPDIPAQAYIMEGDLAESWTAMADGKTWIFKLRPNAKWHNLAPLNGRPVTAEDVAWSFERFMQTSPQKSAFNQVSNVSVADPSTVQFTLKDVYAPFENLLGSPVFWIVPKEVVDQDGDLSRRVVGSGPFIFDKFDSGVSISGKRNADYYRPGEARVEAFVSLILPDTATQMAGLRAHELDYLEVPDQELPGLKRSNPEIQYVDREFNLLPFVYWKVDKPPFNDPRVRQAVSMALNRDNIIQVILNGRGNWNNFVPTALSEWWLDPRSGDQGPTAKNFQYDPATARQLLSAAGYPDGLKVNLISTPGYGDVFAQSVELVQQGFKAAGIDATIQMQEYATYIATTFAGKFEGGNVLVYGLETPFTEPHDYLFNMYHPNGTRNHAGINDAKLTAMIEQQMRTLDKAARKQQIFDIQRYLADQMYYPPGPSQYRMAGVPPSVHDVFARSDYGFGVDIAAKVWLDTA
ncbi:MAG: ABC transporter substrate-binding protein [Chloroflexota bacterium]